MDPDIEKIAQLLVMIAAFSAFLVTLSIAARFGFRKSRSAPLPPREAVDARPRGGTVARQRAQVSLAVLTVLFPHRGHSACHA